MGRGGRSAAHHPGGPGADRVAAAKHVLDASPLANCSTSELEKFAKERGLKNDGTRDGLLLVLNPFSKVCASRCRAGWAYRFSLFRLLFERNLSICGGTLKLISSSGLARPVDHHDATSHTKSFGASVPTSHSNVSFVRG